MTGHRCWAAWFAVAVATFAWLERAALRTGTPTLSAVMRHYLGIYPPRPSRSLRAAAVAGGAVTLAVHLARVPNS